MSAADIALNCLKVEESGQSQELRGKRLNNHPKRIYHAPIFEKDTATIVAVFYMIYTRMINHRKYIIAISVLTLMLIGLMLGTNPSDYGVAVILIWFVLFGLFSFLVSRFLVHSIISSFILVGSITWLLALSTLGQLTISDVVLVIALLAFGINYFKKKHK